VERYAARGDLKVPAFIAATKILEASNLTLLATSCWQAWTTCLVDECKFKMWRWPVLQEALRELRAWRSEAVLQESTSLADVVLEGVLVPQLCSVSAELPLGIFMALGKELREERADFEALVMHCLQGRGGGISLLQSVSVVSGKTIAQCPEGGDVWVALVQHVADKLCTLEDLKLFSCSAPPVLFQRAVLKKMKGWRRLELQRMLYLW